MDDFTAIEQIFNISDKNKDGGLSTVGATVNRHGDQIHQLNAAACDLAAPAALLCPPCAPDAVQGELSWLIKAVNRDASLSNEQLGLVMEEVSVGVLLKSLARGPRAAVPAPARAAEQGAGGGAGPPCPHVYPPVHPPAATTAAPAPPTSLPTSSSP